MQYFVRKCHLIFLKGNAIKNVHLGAKFYEQRASQSRAVPLKHDQHFNLPIVLLRSTAGASTLKQHESKRHETLINKKKIGPSKVIVKANIHLKTEVSRLIDLYNILLSQT